ncbi:MAG: 23S rRNA (guanosine(2251)-2'-O)-methyltransferase RlmB [Synechococcaceae bacterium WB9_2_112]|nr:23S rRNA (guanosine(2251)-2'-O)-methyltransferase RlmB [Synechococcaceae bacterium WB9_2_112]
MSPRFQRRPERRSGSGASGRSADRSGGRFAGPSGERAGGRPAGGAARRWGAAKSEWRPQGAEGEARGDRRALPERPRPRPGDRSGQWRGKERDRNSGSERRPFQRRDERSDAFGRFEPRREPRREPGRELNREQYRDQSRDLSRDPRRDARRSDRDDRQPQGEAESLGTPPPSDLIWGRHPAQAALESGRPIHRIWCTAELRHTPRFLQLLREAKASGVLVEEVTWARLGQLTSGAVHQGIVLQSAAADTLDLPSLIEGCSQIGEPPLLMAIDGLTDPHNLGAIVRSAEALGAHGMVLPQRRCAGLTGSVAKVAAGALEHLPVARVVNLNRALDTLKQEGYRVIGLAAEGNLTLEEADLDGPLVLVTGSEGDGLSMLTRRSCDQLVRIPLRGSTPSLNASVATALLLYEIARRGWMGGLKGQAPAPRIQRPQLPSNPVESDSPVRSSADHALDQDRERDLAGDAADQPTSLPTELLTEELVAEELLTKEALTAEFFTELPAESPVDLALDLGVNEPVDQGADQTLDHEQLDHEQVEPLVEAPTWPAQPEREPQHEMDGPAFASDISL